MVDPDAPSVSRCGYCGQPGSHHTHYLHGHLECATCGRNIDDCCSGEQACFLTPSNITPATSGDPA